MIVDEWVGKKIGLPPCEPLTRGALEAWQLVRLRETIAHALTNSSFYREKYGFPGLPNGGDFPVEMLSIDSLKDIENLPFVTQDELATDGARMVCVPASDVSRIVTLQAPIQFEENQSVKTQATSGTTGEPKRVWFTEEDQELMTDYIHHGLKVMTGPGDVFLVLFPCERPGSVGDLVALGVERIGSRAIRFGPIPQDGSRDDEILELMCREGVTTGLATAPTAARLAARSASGRLAENAPDSSCYSGIREKMRSILLSAQYISESDKDLIETSWGCDVYEHYGMTEMGLGGAMACEQRTGYHPREADLLFEIIDPDNGEVLPEGEYGEIVFTTLTRQAMPFVRYRTGDFSRWLPVDCACGSVLKRLDKVGDRAERKGY